MEPYVILSNNGGTLQKKFRVVSTGYSPAREKIGVQRVTVTGRVDNQCGPVLGKWLYTLRVYETDPTDPTKSDGDTEGYGTLEHLKTFFDYNDPPNNKLLFADFGAATGLSTPSTLPGTASLDDTVGITTWGTPTNITIDNDASYAFCMLTAAPDQSYYLVGSNYGFSVPSGCTIVGITAQVRRMDDYASDEATDAAVYLYHDGGVIGSNKANVSTWASAWENMTYGGDSDTWGAALTPTIVNSSGFGVALSAQIPGPDNAYLQVQYIKLTVHYATNTHYVYLVGTLSEKNLTPHIVGGCACFDVPVSILAAEALA